MECPSGCAVLFTILQTLELWQINPQRWLSCYLQSCAESGNRAPPQLRRFLPWEMDPAQRAAWGRPFWPGGGMKRLRPPLHWRGDRATVRLDCRQLLGPHAQIAVPIGMSTAPVAQSGRGPQGDETAENVAMLRMHREGILQLPPPRNRKGGSSRIEHTFWSAPQPPLSRPVHELPDACIFEPVLSRPDSALWNEYIDRYHYLGHTLRTRGASGELLERSMEEKHPGSSLALRAPAWSIHERRDCFNGWRPSR